MSELPMDQPDIEGCSPEDVAEHIRLAHEAGYVEASWELIAGGKIREAWLRRLTNEGHDFLAAIRDDTVWKKTKEEVERATEAASLQVWKEVATQIVRGILLVSG